MQIPFKPKINSRIGIFTPSEPLTQSRLDRVNDQMDILIGSGRLIKLGTNWMSSEKYAAGTVSQRVSDINKLLSNKAVGMLLTSWGG